MIKSQLVIVIVVCGFFACLFLVLIMNIINIKKNYDNITCVIFSLLLHHRVFLNKNSLMKLLYIIFFKKKLSVK